MLPPLHLLSLREAANTEVPTGVLPRKGNGRPAGADRLNAILKSRGDLRERVNKYREGRLIHELNYDNDGPVQRQLTKEQKAKLGSERNHLECPNPDCSNPDVQVEPDGRAVCQRCGFEVAKFTSDTNDENSSRNVLDNAEEKRQARLHATAEEKQARLEIHEDENAPARDSVTSARANLPGSGAQPASAPALEQVRVGQVYGRTNSPPEPHVRLPADSIARRLPPSRHEAQAQKKEDAQAARATATAATRADQMQGFQAGKEHLPHQCSPVRACALPTVSRGHRQGRNATRGLRLREAWAVHDAFALHCPRVH